MVATVGPISELVMVLGRELMVLVEEKADGTSKKLASHLGIAQSLSQGAGATFSGAVRWRLIAKQ